MFRFEKFLVESSLTQKEKDALWYWQEGNNGKGYQILRSIANGRCPNVRCPNVREIDKLKEIEKDFESAVSKLPNVNGKEVIRVTNTYRPYKVGQSIEFEKFTSFSLDPADSLYDNFGSEGTNVFIVKANKNFKDMSKILHTLTDSEHEVLNDKTLKGKIISVEDRNIGGEKRPDWLGGGYSGGHNFKVIEVKI